MKEELRQHEKRLVIHDLPAGAMSAVKDENIIEICDDGSIKSCIGCFGCWLKTPGKCIFSNNRAAAGHTRGAAPFMWAHPFERRD